MKKLMACISLTLLICWNINAQPVVQNYTHFVTFEDKEWSTEYPIIFPWSGLNRDAINRADERASFFKEETMCNLTTEWANRGVQSARCISASENGAENSKGRRMVELVGNNSEGISRKLKYNKDYWIGFTLMNMEPELGTNWEIYFQLHNNQPSPTGWGPTNNPMVAIERDGNNYYKIIYRHNNADGSFSHSTFRLGEVTVGFSSKFLLHVKLSNPSSDGALKVWQKNTGDNSYKRYVKQSQIKIGYYREDPDNGPVVSMGIYNGPTGAFNRSVYLDDIFISDDSNFSIKHHELSL